VQAIALEEALTHNARPTHAGVFWNGRGFVLLIACANFANLNLSAMVRRELESGGSRRIGSPGAAMFRQLLNGEFLAGVVGGAWPAFFPGSR